MISIRLEYDAQTLSQIQTDIESFQVIAYALFRQSYNKMRPALLRALRFTPRRRYWESSDFQSDAQRRAFFAKTGGKAYQRTGAYAAGWEVMLQDKEGGGQVVIRNRVPHAKFVGGSFSRSRNFQQRGHKRTGWPLSQNTADRELTAMQADFEQRLTKYIKAEFGMTSSRRNR